MDNINFISYLYPILISTWVNLLELQVQKNYYTMLIVNILSNELIDIEKVIKITNKNYPNMGSYPWRMTSGDTSKYTNAWSMRVIDQIVQII